MWKVFQQDESQIITALDTSNSETNMSLTMPPHSWRHRHFIHCFSDYPLPDRAMSIGGTEYEHNGILQCLLIGDKVVYPKQHSDKGKDTCLLSPKHASADPYRLSCIETDILWNKGKKGIHNCMNLTFMLLLIIIWKDYLPPRCSVQKGRKRHQTHYNRKKCFKPTRVMGLRWGWDYHELKL